MFSRFLNHELNLFPSSTRAKNSQTASFKSKIERINKKDRLGQTYQGDKDNLAKG